MKTIVIVGGGISGLFFAEKLVSSNPKINIRILECTDVLGGNIRTFYDKDIMYETGAGRFNKNHKLLLGLLKKYNLTPIKIASTKKDFRPVLCSTTNKKVINSNELIMKVLDYSEKLPKSILQSITFGQLCDKAIGYKKTKELIASFGYNAEFLIANAYTSLIIFRADFSDNYDYYICKEGLSELVKRIELYLLSNGVIISKNHKLLDFSCKNNGFALSICNTVSSEYSKIRTNHLVLAIPKKALLEQPFFTESQKRLLDSVEGINLHRIYAQYKSDWMKTTTRTTTDLHIRQYIPINKEKHIAMVSYSDMNDADYWKVYADMKKNKLETEVHNQLSLLFPDLIISKTNWIRSYFWENGVHCWKAGVDPIYVRKQIAKISPNLHIIGESYSMRQGWIEGALQTANLIFQQLKPL